MKIWRVKRQKSARERREGGKEKKMWKCVRFPFIKSKHYMLTCNPQGKSKTKPNGCKARERDI